MRAVEGLPTLPEAPWRLPRWLDDSVRGTSYLGKAVADTAPYLLPYTVPSHH